MGTKDFKSASIPVDKKSKHNLGNTWCGTLSFGRLVPIYCKPVTPGEIVNYRPHILVQTPAFASLTFGRMKVKQFSFFVPSRIIWSDFQNFVTGGSDGRQIYTQPKTTLDSLAKLSFMEPASGTDDTNRNRYRNQIQYLKNGLGWTSFESSNRSTLNFNRGLFSDLITSLGINIYKDSLFSNTTSLSSSTLDFTVSLLPFRAYQKVWWDWFRDSTLIPESNKSVYLFSDGGTKTYTSTLTLSQFLSNQLYNTCRSRNISYDKDYFTTARLSPQQGLPSLVPVDIGTGLNSNLTSRSTQNENDASITTYKNALGEEIVSVLGNGSSSIVNNVIGQFQMETFRLANSLQRFLERNNVLGTRPLAQLLGRFGVAPSAARLDMAEFIGGDERNIDPIQVVQSAETSQKKLADRAAFGKLFYSAEMQNYRCEEHGWFISLICIVPEVEYCDGIDRMFCLDSKEDYYQSEYENLGFEAIPLYELYSPITYTGSLTETFGFVPRYSWMKWKRSTLQGDFVRPDTSTGADSWHSYRRFNNDTKPILDYDFVTCYANDPYDNWNRLFDDTTSGYEPFKVNVWNENDAQLPMEGAITPALESVYQMQGRKIRIPYGGVRL